MAAAHCLRSPDQPMVAGADVEKKQKISRCRNFVSDKQLCAAIKKVISQHCVYAQGVGNTHSRVRIVGGVAHLRVVQLAGSPVGCCLLA